jgi:flagellar M-ring protein FliF
MESTPIWEAPWVPSVAKQAVGAGLVLLVAFLILRPLMKSLTKTPRGNPRIEEGEDRVSLSGQGGKPIKLQASFEQQIAAARTLVGQDPKRAAQVVKDWVAADG